VTSLHPDLTWSCHFCGDERPDEKIAVAVVETRSNTGVEIRHTRRYCRDREQCEAAAAAWALKGDPFST
jgi:hypothetical protein